MSHDKYRYKKKEIKWMTIGWTSLEAKGVGSPLLGSCLRVIVLRFDVIIS